jgi:hypothetical protein
MAQPPPKKQTDQKQPEAPPSRRGRVAAIGRDAGPAAAAGCARAGFTDPAMILHWVEIAGPEVARIARPVRFSEKDGALTLMAEPGAALFLAHESRSLAARINQYLGRTAVTRVKFVQGKLQQTPLPPPPPRPAKAPKSTDPANSYSGPDDLKAALQSLARWRVGNEDRGD